MKVVQALKIAMFLTIAKVFIIKLSLYCILSNKPL